MPHCRIFSDPISNLSNQEKAQSTSLDDKSQPPQYSIPGNIFTHEQEQTASVSNSNGQATFQVGSTTHESSSNKPRSINNYQLIKTLGSGSMGKVKLGLHNITGEKVAIKIISRTPLAGRKRSANFKNENREVRVVREAAIMSLLNHPNIVKMKEIVIRPSHYYLIMEYVSGGQLLDYIISHGRLKEKHARKFIRQLCSAIDYCHRNSIVHRDLKIENILIADDGCIKIIDFGLSNLFSPQSQLSTFCGSLYFAAPELLSAKAYIGPEVDIWSIGIILYVLVCGKVPFDDQNQPALHAKIKRGHIDYPSWLSSDCKHLISRILVTKPSERATMAEILRHPWISKGYDGPPNNYVPHRTPLQLPLNIDIIRGMAGFGLGDETHIKEELESIIGSESYQNQTAQISSFKLPRSFGGYLKKSMAVEEKPINHPIISIYYLAQEKLDHERIHQEKVGLDYVARSSHKSPSIDIERTSEKDQHRALSYETGLEEIRKAAANYLPPIAPITATETCGQSAAVVSDRPSIKHKRRHSTTGGVLRRLSQVIRTGRGYHHNSNDEHVNAERHLDIIPEVSNIESNRQEIPKTSASCVRTGMDESQPLNSHTPTRRKSKLIWFTTHSRKADHESTNNPSFNQDSHCRTNINVKPVFLKGLFSVATTSTKRPSVIRADIIRVLNDLGCTWQESMECFKCSKGEPSEASNSDRTSSSSFANSADSQSQEDIVLTHLSGSSTSKSTSSTTTSECQEDINNTLGSHPVKFQISIVKIPWLLGLHGLQFRRLSGHPWEYKNLCQKILRKLNL